MNDSLSFSDVSERHYSTALGSSKLRFEFTGTGAEYFKLWIVNLLLTLATLGLYYPWAKVRRLKYFFANTQLDGDPLEYDGAPSVIARGYALLLIMAGLSWVAGYYAKAAGAAAVLVVALACPALLHASLRYHLVHTTWRGLRFGFNGTRKEAYWATAPLIGAGGMLLSLALLALLPKTMPTWLGYGTAVLGIVCLILAPWRMWIYKQYEHKHFTLGTLKARFKATPQDFYRLFLQIYLFAAILISIATSLALDWLDAVAPVTTSKTTLAHSATTTVLVYLTVVTLSAWLAIRPFATSRLQNLVWTQTGNSSLRCLSLLRYRALVWLGLKNSLLMVATLGLYWPFATVATTRLRMESVQIKTRVDPNVLVSTARPAAGKASAERPKGILGFDVSL